MTRHRRTLLIVGVSLGLGLMALAPTRSLAGVIPCAPLCPPPSTATPAPAVSKPLPVPPATPTTTPVPQPSVLVTFGPTHVRPGDGQKLSIVDSQAPHAFARVTVHFPDHHVLMRKQHLDAKGKRSLSWRVPDKLAPGSGKVVVLLQDKGAHLNKVISLPFTVEK